MSSTNSDANLTAAQEILIEYLTGMALTAIYFVINFVIFGVMSVMAARQIYKDRKLKKIIDEEAAEANEAAKLKKKKKKGEKNDADDDDSDNDSDGDEEGGEESFETDQKIEEQPEAGRVNTVTETENTKLQIVPGDAVQIELQNRSDFNNEESEKSFALIWWDSLKERYETYKDVLPHLFDTASDVGAIIEFYTLWTILTDDGIRERLPIAWVFFASIFIIIGFRTISAFTIYYITKNPWDILWQYLDVMLVKCVYYGRSFEEPTYLENYLALLETLFEAAPEMIISVAFMARTVEAIPIIVILSFLFSLFMLTSTLIDEDDLRFSGGKTMLKMEFLGAMQELMGGAKQCVYEQDFDKNGILYGIGTQFDEEKEWQNPSWKRDSIQPVQISVSPNMAKGHYSAGILGRTGKFVMIGGADKPEKDTPWFMLDFSQSRMKIKPTHYTLRHGSKHITNYMTDWELEGSVDGSDGSWTVIKSHKGDTSLKGDKFDEFKSATFQIESCTNFYTQFRVRMTGENAENNWKMLVSGFEVYGAVQYSNTLSFYFLGQWQRWMRVLGWRSLEVTSRIFLLTLIWQILGGVAFGIAIAIDICIVIYATKKTEDFGWVNYLVYITNAEFEHVWLPSAQCGTCWSHTDPNYDEWDAKQEEEQNKLRREIKRTDGKAEVTEMEARLAQLEKEDLEKKDVIPRFQACGACNKFWLDKDNDPKYEFNYRFETEMFRWRVCSHLLYLILCTMFALYPLGLPNDSWFISSFEMRNEFAPNNTTAPTNLPKLMFLYTWIATLLWPMFLLFLKYQNEDNLPSINYELVERKPDALYTSENIQPIRELVYQQARLDWSEFLTTLDAEKEDSCQLFYECFVIRPEIKHYTAHMTKIFSECLYMYYLHFCEYMLEQNCSIDMYKKEHNGVNISQLQYCMMGQYCPNDMIECGLLLWKHFEKDEKIEQLTWTDGKGRTIDDIKAFCITNEARDLVQEWRKEVGLPPLEHLDARTTGYPRRESYIESEMEEWSENDYSQTDDKKTEEEKMIQRSKALSDKIWNAGWHPNRFLESDFPEQRLLADKVEKRLTDICAAYKVMKRADNKEEKTYIGWKNLDKRYQKKHGELIKILKEKYQTDGSEWKEDRKEFRLEESVNYDWGF